MYMHNISRNNREETGLSDKCLKMASCPFFLRLKDFSPGALQNLLTSIEARHGRRKPPQISLS